MIIAQEKRETNIAEYIIYMFQIEDILRALNFDEKAIQKYVANTFSKYPDKLEEIQNWYMGLNDLMIVEELKSKGHLSIIENSIHELNDFHQKILQNPDYLTYIETHKIAVPFIKEFSQRSNASSDSEIMICMNALYLKLLMKLKNMQISAATEEAFSAISTFIAQLSNYFNKYETGKFEL